eukprot:CAMPEP_0197667122 /NCGR_PEP_ID=MMETSP1338-20131121/65198_1 /TAXON_ID=43686 ORGANISM="Pelagodinium beii, Strain RCC1491" /NCGR_SAMPLE_ID=MMETSP1338 /ASSEMBLY_ACC=CAM_ASM_000754 /LENGTH=58 /DNA_ID=CAMNT_0043246297 /DNA_START=30 /DNA_END=206 /DNA_ORIENTATION=+
MSCIAAAMSNSSGEIPGGIPPIIPAIPGGIPPNKESKPASAFTSAATASSSSVCASAI